jgi:hypothetical protein
MNTLKNPCSLKKLAIKHALLVATINNVDTSSSMRQKVHVLGVHHRNMMYAVKCSKLIDDNNLFLWTFSIKKQRSDVLNATKIVIVTTWWVSKTRISFDRWRVTQKKIAPFQHDEKSTHFFMETHVSNCI